MKLGLELRPEKEQVQAQTAGAPWLTQAVLPNCRVDVNDVCAVMPRSSGQVFWLSMDNPGNPSCSEGEEIQPEELSPSSLVPLKMKVGQRSQELKMPDSKGSGYGFREKTQTQSDDENLSLVLCTELGRQCTEYLPIPTHTGRCGRRETGNEVGTD